MSDVRKIILVSEINKAALETALNLVFPGGIPGGGMLNFSIALTTVSSQVPPANWWGGSGWYPQALADALTALPALCDVYPTDSTRATFVTRLASHLPQLFFVQYPEE